MDYQYTVLQRFLKYVQVDTQSDPRSDKHPTTEKQKDLSKILVEEMKAMGIEDAHMDEWAVVYGTIPANTDKAVPTICFCSHVDTAPDCSGTDVKPIVHENYDGRDLVLPDDPTQIINPTAFPALNDKMGHNIVSASGHTLLGADDKAGVAEIMDAAHYLLTHPELKHGTVKLLFTPDEEVGKGTAKVDLKKLGADFAYTLDGALPGEYNIQNFSANGFTININGVSAHPGYAKGKMEHAAKIAGEILARLPKDRCAPEVADKLDGFVHPTRLTGGLENASIGFIIRDFDTAQLDVHENMLKEITASVLENYPNSTATFESKMQYRNMKEIVDQHPQLVDIAQEAIRQTGVEPYQRSIRGGTDGAWLSYAGLPCPNLFTGMQAIHSKREWISQQDMEQAVEMIVNVVLLFEQQTS